ncbi:MAG: hypothetical protein EOO41_03210 [Methanobacteriota archaeon]|nr:MAG: hypothetical protein EOO41_03210 [Euryarchaeota archaeon]
MVQALKADRAELQAAAERKHAADSVLQAETAKTLRVTQEKLANVTRGTWHELLADTRSAQLPAGCHATPRHTTPRHLGRVTGARAHHDADYLMQRHHFQQFERRIMEQLAVLQSENSRLKAEMDNAKVVTAHETSALRTAADDDNKALRMTLQYRSDVHADEMRILQVGSCAWRRVSCGRTDRSSCTADTLRALAALVFAGATWGARGRATKRNRCAAHAPPRHAAKVRASRRNTRIPGAAACQPRLVTHGVMLHYAQHGTVQPLMSVTAHCMLKRSAHTMCCSCVRCMQVQCASSATRT